MRFVKLGLFSVLFLSLLILAISLLLPSTAVVTRTTNIHAPQDSIYAYINNVAQWKYWMEYYDTLSTTSPTSVGKGATINRANTSVAITQTSPGQILTEWRMNSRHMQGDFNFIDRKDSAVITVEWAFSQHVKWYPWEKFGTILMEKRLGPFMEKSLENLKERLEK